MMEYIVSARKYRPLTFDSVVGQSSLTSTLKNSVKTGKLAHAYLFCGPRGVGKTTCARIFAKVINCTNPTGDGDACGECESCQAFNEQRSFNIFELDAASNNGVEHIKTLMEQTRIPPQVGKYKVFIIDEVHMLSTAAFNAFLKTLEEPPSYVIFILATTEKHKLLPTIISRCQIYDFERMTVPNIVNHLKMVADKEGITYEEEALNVIAEKADGGMRDALSVFDQVASFCQGNITYDKVIEDLNVLASDTYFQIVDLSLQNNVYDIMVLVNQTLAKGFDGGQLVNGLSAHLRNIMMAKDQRTVGMLQASAAQKEKYVAQAQKCSPTFIYKALKILNSCDVNYRQSSNKRLLVELTLIEVAQITQPEEPGSGRRPNMLKTLFKIFMKHRQSGTEMPAEKKQISVTAQPNVTTNVSAPVSQQPSSNATNVASNLKTEKPATVQSANNIDVVKETPNPKPQSPQSVNFTKIATGSGFSLNGLKKSGQNQPTTQAAENIVDEDEKFTDEQLLQEWFAMCNRMPEKFTAMASRLRNLLPVITEFPKVELVFTNQMFHDEVSIIRSRIQATLRNCLHNKNIVLEFRIAKPSIKPILSQRERFEKIKAENGALKELFETLGMTIVT
ncbi:MAG: DNA polymerase III subunit gamma/tau [Bacteroidaceae bacterium]|nr:DNA polymerase III subunit gamma/tau [Bacteroidaceae bacterium]